LPGEKQAEHVETAGSSSPSASALASQVTDPLTNQPASQDIETPAPPTREKSAVKKFMRKRTAEPLQTETSQPADLPPPAQKKSPVSVPDPPVAASAESSPDEPRFFVPSRIRFFDPAADTSDEKSSTTPQVGNLKA